MEPSTQRSIAERAAQQLAHLTRSQLHEDGVSNRTILRWEQNSRLVKLGGHTFRLGGVPIDWRGSVMAACLEADAQRENELLLLGYRVLMFTHDDVVRRPAYVAATVASALGLACAA